MRKKKVKGNYLRDPDVIFGTLVHDSTATIVAEQGLVMLKVADDPQPFFLPEGVVLPAEAYGETVDVTIRNITHEVVQELGEDDIYEDELEDNPKLMAVDQWGEVKRLLEECKLRTITKNSKSFSTCLAGLALCLVSGYLLMRGFLVPEICYGGMAVGAIAAIVCIIKPIRQLLFTLNTKTICDGANNWINVETGKTNLNGGLQIPSSQMNDWGA